MCLTTLQRIGLVSGILLLTRNQNRKFLPLYGDPTQLDFSSRGIAERALLFEPQVLRCTATCPAGRAVTVLIDTGTDPSAIDLELARQLGLPLGEFALGHGAASDTIPYTETMLPWLRIGDLTLRNLFTLALDLRSLPFHVDLVLGYNVLCQVVFHIDYAQRLLRLSHADLGIPPVSSTGAVLPLAFFEHFPALTSVTLRDEVCLPLATIDTGSNGGLTLGPDLAQRMGLHHNSETVTLAEGAGFGGRRDILRGSVETMSVGPFTLRDVELDTPGGGAGDLSRQGRANIGNRLLARFASVTLDYGRKMCVLEPWPQG